MIIKGKTYNTNPVTVRHSVNDYLEAMHKKYTEEYRIEWEKIDKEYKAEEKRWQGEIRRGWNDMQMKQKETTKHKEKIKSIMNKFTTLSENANEWYNSAIAEADTRFERHARATGDKIDLPTVELLKSDILSDNEIKALADDFEGNIAMLHIIGKYAEERANTTQNSASANELKSLAITTKNASFNYREPLETYSQMAVTALSADETKTFPYHKVLNDSFSDVLEANKDLYVSREWKSGDTLE